MPNIARKKFGQIIPKVTGTIDFPTRPVDCTQAIKRCLIGAGSDGFLLKMTPVVFLLG
jgi:hypothetical protein